MWSISASDLVSPKVPHAEAVLHICRYLLLTRDDGIIFDSKSDKDFEVYADADLCCNWNRATVMNDMSTAKSRTGFDITFASCPVTWTPKLQTQMALSTTGDGYIALYQSLREVIPIMHIMKETNALGISTFSTNPKVYWKA
jgi:hypothetical protein